MIKLAKHYKKAAPSLQTVSFMLPNISSAYGYYFT
ncbi:hypothetical protein swp_4964 [Shewanella piezotolerans WP3]|uniref:Uncharacterized protein n=1 Tax=Shewanella piezotolerans (strain WP3 / JCM 13877) TaxID=225849 RepID=B8CVA4_SHEPW|nr:hypothetical protein swp_4964 [Shewanella piezotolerans WP3]